MRWALCLAGVDIRSVSRRDAAVHAPFGRMRFPVRPADARRSRGRIESDRHEANRITCLVFQLPEEFSISSSCEQDARTGAIPRIR